MPITRYRTVRLERVEAAHLGDIAEIERLCFAFPWSEQSLGLLLTDRAVGFAVTDGGRAVAYGGMVCVLDEGQITNVATHPDFRRRGYARDVMTALISYAESAGISVLTLEVRESNAAAIRLYEELGFYRVGERRDFYRQPVETAILMQKDI